LSRKTTLLRWHRQGFKLFWKYKSRAASLKPRISQEIVDLIKEMARDNRLWGAERIRGEWLKLGIRVCKRTIQKYMRAVRTTRPRGQTWTTFLQTHAQQICVVISVIITPVSSTSSPNNRSLRCGNLFAESLPFVSFLWVHLH
jgi:hypothetical protein